MGDSEGPKAKGIPSWQRQESSNPPKQLDNTPPSKEPAEQETPEPRASLTEQASKFLEDESIRDAPIERKKLFLESKGLKKTEIDDMLEIQHTPEAAVMEDYGIEHEEASQSTPPTTSQQPSPPPPPQERPPAAPSNDQPPIITYPEFLLHAQKPAPLITANRLLTSLYIATGTFATVYGTSKYIVEPMLESMTSARHALLSSAGANIDALNAKLSSAVSKIPETRLRSEEEEEDGKGDGSDAESVSADGARFFHRSAGTQTTPRLSRSNSAGSSEAVDKALSLAQDQTGALVGIHSKLSDLLPKEGGSTDPLGDSVSELRAYLEKLPHANSPHLGGNARKRGEVDAVANVKAEIRGVKGVLLSARNFPSGVRAR